MIGGRRAGQRQAHRSRFSGRRAEARPDLEQPHGTCPVTAIVTDRRDEPGKKRRTQRIEFCGQRVCHADHTSARAGERFGGCRFDEPERDGLRHAGGCHHTTYQAVARNPRIRRRRRHRHRRKRRREPVEPVMSRHLFDQVCFTGQIDAERWSDDIPAVSRRRYLQAEAAQDSLDIAIGYDRSEQQGEAGAAQVNTYRAAR